MKFFVSSPKRGQLGNHLVSCRALPNPVLETCVSKDDAERLAAELNAAYERWRQSPNHQRSKQWHQ